MMNDTLRTFMFSVCVSICLGCESPTQAIVPTRFHFEEIHMGAKVKITLYAPYEATAASAARAAFNEIAAWDMALSDYMAESEVSKLPKLADEPATVQARLAKAITKSLEFNHSSSGAFDCALGRLSKVWRTAFRESSLPSDAVIADALNHSGCAHMHWNEPTHTVTFDIADIQFDFGAIGQGLAADAAMQVLRTRDISCALIDISGDILASDAPPQSTGWVVQVDPEFQSEQPRILLLRNQALCVSGDRAQPGYINGKTLSHILNPKNGRPIESPRQSMVIANDATTADAIATIACVMSVEQLKDFAKKFPEAHISIERLKHDGGLQSIGQ
jgi:FAD:protein FMN transferase